MSAFVLLWGRPAPVGLIDARCLELGRDRAVVGAGDLQRLLRGNEGDIEGGVFRRVILWGGLESFDVTARDRSGDSERSGSIDRDDRGQVG